MRHVEIVSEELALELGDRVADGLDAENVFGLAATVVRGRFVRAEGLRS